MPLGYLPLNQVTPDQSASSNNNLMQLAMMKKMQEQQQGQGGGAFGWMDPLHTMGNTLNKSGSEPEGGMGSMDPGMLSALLGQIGASKSQPGGQTINPSEITSVEKADQPAFGDGSMFMNPNQEQDSNGNWVNKTGGIVTGAATGAKLGSFGGPIGMGIGAVLGGLLGAFKK
jgi:hypothetical protein